MKRSAAILPFIFLLLCSCSVQKRLAKDANNLINDSLLTHAFIGIAVYDVAANKYLFYHDADKYFIPASNTKLFTLYAGLQYLGDSLPGLRYYQVSDTSVMIVPTADPTFLHPAFKNQPAFAFLQKFTSIGIHFPAFTSYLGKGWAWDDYEQSYMAQRSSMPLYGNVINISLIGSNPTVSPKRFFDDLTIQENITLGFDIKKAWDNNNIQLISGSNQSAEIPFRPDEATILTLLSDTLKNKIQAIALPPGVVFTSLPSQRVDSFYRMMMHNSDNFFAEQTLLMVSLKLTGQLNVEKTIRTVLQSNLENLPQKPKWVDGSGLSRYNLFTPGNFIEILKKLQDTFGIARLKNILATGGQGTLENYFQADSTNIYAKTGTLSNNLALSGYLFTSHNRRLIFSIMANHYPGNATPVRRSIEKFIKSIIKNY
ncbi:MAG: D-alanyl-D-alanine carboxypeptidase [Ferruginibacter sp.]